MTGPRIDTAHARTTRFGPIASVKALLAAQADGESWDGLRPPPMPQRRAELSRGCP